MDSIISFGEWTKRRRKMLNLTQADLAQKVSCSLSMLRKIERDERRPSEQLAELMADHLAIDVAERSLYLRMARGQYVPDLPAPADVPLSAFDPPADAILTDRPAPFVGRVHELQELHTELDRATQGQGRIVFVAGEAGRGKTSLLDEFARQALERRADLLVTGGRSDVYTGLGDPLLPVRDSLRLLAGEMENPGVPGILSRTLAARVAAAQPEIAALLLDHGPHLIDTLIPGKSLDAQLARIPATDAKSAGLRLRLRELQARQNTRDLQQERVFDEISSFLSMLARKHPLLLILDDLHWVDTATAGLLGHLALRLQRSPILIVGSFRPEELIARHAVDAADSILNHPLQHILTESRRLFGDNRINLERHDPADQLGFVSALLDKTPNHLGSEFRQTLAELTQGNALFTLELIRDLQERGRIVQDQNGYWMQSEVLQWAHLPARVEGVIEKRILRLNNEERAILNLAAVQGETFIAEVIAKVRQVEMRRLSGILGSVLDQRHHLIRAEGVVHAGPFRLSHYRFRHQLFQQYLYEQLSEAERMYLHEDVGKALAALYSDRPALGDIPAVQLARHFQEARLGSEAARFLHLAGDNAARVTAYDEAAAHYAQALLLLQESDPRPDAERARFALTLARASARWHGGHVADAVRAYEDAITLARTLDDPEPLAEAVLAYEQPRWRLNLPAQESQRNLHEALVALGDQVSSIRVRLLVRLARARQASTAPDELLSTVDQALEMARQVGDPLALCEALQIFAQLDRRPETANRRLAAIHEFVALARVVDNPELLADALSMEVYDQLELGNIDLVDAAIEEQQQVAEESNQPFQLHLAAVFRTMRAILRGEFLEAERLAYAAGEISRELGVAELDGILGMHMFTIRTEQGRLHEVAPIVKLYVAANPGTTTWRPGLAMIYAALNDRASCRQVFDALAADGFASIPRDSMWVTVLAYLASTCAYLEDKRSATILYDLLLPYAGRTVVAGGATACYGAVTRYLGMLARTMGMWTAARAHFTAALELDARMGARPWLDHSRVEFAAMLLAQGDAAERPRAQELLGTARDEALEMSMGYLLQKVKTLETQYELAPA